jgi:outer membrane protein assembly factor BamD
MRENVLSLRNRLARAEIHVANYYFTRGAYLAAANRGRYVVENFQQSPAVPDGLATMAQAYYMLDMKELADNSAQVLVANYPDHPALTDEGKFDYERRLLVQEDTILDKLSFGVIKRIKPPAFDSRSTYDRVTREAEVGNENESQTGGKRSIWSKLTFGLLG